jgi:two-component system, cell cycle response regulator
MLANNALTILLASYEPALLSAVEPALLASGARVEIVLSAEAALASMTASTPPTLALIDVSLSGLDQGAGAFLTTIRVNASSRRLPIVLIADTVTKEWKDRLAEGVIDDLILRSTDTPYLRLRLDMVLRAFEKTHEVESLRKTALLNAQTDRLTGVYNRETILSMLFRETDRVQRMKSSLCMILFDIDDFGHWNSRLGAEACDDLLCQVVSRTNRLLRSYDLLGRPGKDEFLVALPGCTGVNAVMLAERLRLDVFSPPYRIDGDSIRLSACFGIATSQGRSPVVVLREAEQALQLAKAAGPETIQCFSGCPDASAAPVTYLSPSTGDELLAW